MDHGRPRKVQAWPGEARGAQAMKHAKAPAPEEKPLTARPPQDAVMYAADVPRLDSRGQPDNTKHTAPGCYWTPRRRGAE
jgi:hypothetical protein